MRRHINYLKYIIRHKWYVFLAARRLGCPIWLAIIHDWSKFRPSEWFPYARCFYKSNGEKQYDETPEFNYAWLHHQKRNKHHWQYWLITWDRGNTEALEIPSQYVLEMVADWAGAGRAITGRWEVLHWYHEQEQFIQLHPKTRLLVEFMLESFLDSTKMYANA